MEKILIHHDYYNFGGIYLTFPMAYMNHQQFWRNHPFSAYVEFFEKLTFLRYAHELLLTLSR